MKYFFLLTVFKIKAVEVEALNQVPQSLRLKRRHSRVTHFTEGQKPQHTELTDVMNGFS